jgi:hypothetical protein
MASAPLYQAAAQDLIDREQVGRFMSAMVTRVLRGACNLGGVYSRHVHSAHYRWVGMYISA